MALTGYEKPLSDYTKAELVEIAKKYKPYYKTASGIGKIDGYERLTKEQLVNLIKNEVEYIEANPKLPRRVGRGKRYSNQLRGFKESLLGTESPEEMMDEIISRLSGSERNSIEPGHFYTYIYYAATPRIRYDRHPLIIAGGTLPKGFWGFNVHWKSYRQYNTEDGDRLVSGLYELSREEFSTLLSVPYGKIVSN